MEGFDSWDISARNALIQQSGYHLVTVREGKYCATLYSVNGFLVERYFNLETARWDAIQSVPFSCLDKYLEFVTLYELYWL